MEGLLVEHHRFDTLTRTVAARLPRRGLAPLLGALVGLGLEGADARGRKHRKHDQDGKDRNGSQDDRQKTRQGRHDPDKDRNGSGQGDRKDHGSGASAEGKKKKPKCVGAGSSCKKPKKGKPKKCCAGLSCDGTTKRCTTPGGDAPPPPPGGGGGGTASCDEAAFEECFAPWAADWDAAVTGCTEACSTSASTACQQCLEPAISGLADPFAFCFGRTCSSPTATARVAAARVAAAGPAPCDPLELSKCNTQWLVGELLADLGLMLSLNVPGLASAIITGIGGQVFNVCNDQFGCLKGHSCIPEHGVCCQDCAGYDPNSTTCHGRCTADETCQFGRCVQTRCKQCLDYADGNTLACGQIVNNCGETLTCSCPGSQRCTAGHCCIPKASCAGTECGVISDGCGGTIDCGACPCPKTCSARNNQGATACCREDQACCSTGPAAQIPICCDTICRSGNDPHPDYRLGCCPAELTCLINDRDDKNCCWEGWVCRGPGHYSPCCAPTGTVYPEDVRVCCSGQPDCTSGLCVCA